jgi:hypothetical protein
MKSRVQIVIKESPGLMLLTEMLLSES